MNGFFDEDTSPNTIEKLDALCKRLKELRESIVQQKDTLKALHNQEYALEKTIANAIIASGRTNYSSPHGTISVGQRLSVSMPQNIEDKKKFFDYLKQEGMYDSLITVNSNTLNSFIKSKKQEMEENGVFDDLNIPGLPPPNVMEIISFRKG